MMFYRSTTLSPSHYAGKWIIPAEDARYDLKVVNQLGLEYAKAIDSPEKEARLLQVIECFHGYLMKYVVMIIRGTIPTVNTPAGKDAKELLRTLSPRGAVLDKEQIDRACKTLHLAFKQATTEEIYDTLVFCLIKAARKYDPFTPTRSRKCVESLMAYRSNSQNSISWIGLVTIVLGFCVLSYASTTCEALRVRRRSWDTR